MSVDGKSSKKLPIRLVALLIILITGVLIHTGVIDVKAIMDSIEAHKDTPAGIFIFLGLYSIMPVFLIPTLPMNILAGFIWGTVMGFYLSMISSILGSILPFLVARYVLHEFVLRMIRRFDDHWMIQRLKSSSWKFVAITRLNPAIPSTILSYFFGVTEIRFLPYLVTSSIFTVPPALAMSMVGHSFKNFYEFGFQNITILLLILALTIFAFLWMIKPKIVKILEEKKVG